VLKGVVLKTSIEVIKCLDESLYPIPALLSGVILKTIIEVMRSLAE